MNYKKNFIIKETYNYLQFKELFTSSGLEFNLDETGEKPEGLILAYDDISKKGLTIDVDCDDDLIIQSSQESLKHILMNLIQNAIEAVEEKTDIIIIRAYEDKDNIIIECQDNGCGIAKDNLEYLFNPFFTTKPQGEGTGLGLYVVYSEIKYLGGHIDVNSTLGKGTTFFMKLKNQKDA